MFLYEGAYHYDRTWIPVAAFFILFETDLTTRLKAYRALIEVLRETGSGADCVMGLYGHVTFRSSILVEHCSGFDPILSRCFGK